VEPVRIGEQLRKVLPPYMVPGRWLALEVLPKNVNGKIDRRGLRELFEQGADEKPVAKAI
jgi:acyl-coenzyme A synthetase/AMP-(fatty) acid ligase